MIRATHIIRRSVVAVAAAALLTAPAALAGGTSQYGPHDTWYAYATSRSMQPDTWLGYAVALTSRERNEQPTGLSFTTDTLAPGGGNTISSPSVGFDWGDAGIGAGVTLGTLLIASVAGVALVRRRGRLVF